MSQHQSSPEYILFNQLSGIQEALRHIVEHKSEIGASTIAQSYERFRMAHEEWVNGTLGSAHNSRQSEWTESIAVGSEPFTRWIQEKLGFRTKGRKVIESTSDSGGCLLREMESGYIDDFAPQMEHIGAQNAYFWNDNHETSTV